MKDQQKTEDNQLIKRLRLLLNEFGKNNKTKEEEDLLTIVDWAMAKFIEGHRIFVKSDSIDGDVYVDIHLEIPVKPLQGVNKRN